MTNQDILKRAELYAKQEEHTTFRLQVEKLLEENEPSEDLRDRFYTDLSFGTGGLRGVIGGGYNRMNPFVVKKATQGLANYICKNVDKEKRIAVLSHDSRNYADLFALEAALVLAANGIKTYLYPSLRPTPQLSFSVRLKKACTGIMVTASHNPAEYNGYKVFWEDGGQVTPPHDTGIISEVRDVQDSGIKTMDKQKALDSGMLVYMGEEEDKAYHDMVKSKSLRPEMVKENASKIKAVFTPLHGCGRVPVETVLKDMGVEIFTVPEQAEPDGDFSTVDFPNPEIAPAMDLALKLAKEKNADIVLGTDPDADRLGIAVPVDGGYQLISGNQLGVLLTDYIFTSLKEKGTMPANPAFVNTIVTSELQNLVAQSYGADTYRVLTGFKYIGEKIREFETDGSHSYIFGGEESYGFLIGTEVRDKDAISAALLSIEMALWNVLQGRTVLEHLNDIYSRFGFFQEVLISRYFKGEQGLQIMGDLMTSLRKNPPKQFGALKTVTVRDYKDGTTLNMSDGSKMANIDLPSSNVLQFVLEDGSLVTARPSGTEPKIKFYASCRGAENETLENAKKSVSVKIKGIEDQINELIPS